MRKFLMILAVLFLAIGVASCTGAQNISITFEENGGSEVEDLTISINSTSVNFPTPVREGYTFDGWYLDEALTQPFTLASLLTQTTALTLYAKWDADVVEYTITFESNGGSAVTAITAAAGASVTAPSDPTKTGYTFMGWFSDSALTTAYTFTTMPSENITLYAKWELIVNNQTITFEENGGSAVADITQAIGSAVTAPANPTKVGNTFAGWYSDQALTTAYTFSTMPENPLTLYAKWTVNNYTISFEENGGSAVTDITQAYGSAVVAPTAPTRTGYTFAGWYSDQALTTAYTFSTMPAANTTLYAKWTVNQYTISFEENGGSAVADLTQDFGSAVVAPAAPTRTGYTFGGWFSDQALTTAYTFSTMPAVNTTLYAKWTAANFTISFEENGGSAVTDITQAFGSAVVAPTAPTRLGYTFGGWYSDQALTTAYTFTTMPAANTTLYAKWTVNQYTITFEENGGTTVADLTQNFGSTVVEPTDPTQQGYVFVAWYSDAELTTLYTFTTMPAQNITLYAKWDYIEYTLSFVGADITSQTIKAYDPIVLPANPTKEGYTFGGWFFDTLFLEPYDLTVMPEHDVELHALWTPNLYTLTYMTDGGTALDPEEIPFNAIIQYRQDVEKEGYAFAGWYLDSTLETPLDGHRMPAGPLTLYAKWIATDTVWTIADVLMYEPGHAKVEGTVIYKFPTPMNPGYYVYDGTATIFVMAPSNDILVGDYIQFDADFGYFEFTPQFTNQQNRVIVPDATPMFPSYPDEPVLNIIHRDPAIRNTIGSTVRLRGGVLINEMGQYFLSIPGSGERLAINYKSINPMSDPFVGLAGQLVEFNAIIYGFDPMGHMWHVLYDPSGPVTNTSFTDSEKIQALIASADMLNGMVFYPGNVLELPAVDPLFGATLTFETTGDNAAFFNVTTGVFADTEIQRSITLHITATLGLETGSVDVTLTLMPLDILTISEFFGLPDESFGMVRGVVIFANADMGIIIIGDETGAILPIETMEPADVGDLIIVQGYKFTMEMIAIMGGDKDQTILEVLATDQPMPFAPVPVTVAQFLGLDPMNSLYWGRLFTINGTLDMDDMTHEVWLIDGELRVQLMVTSQEFYMNLRDLEGFNVGVTGIALPNFDGDMPVMMFIVMGNPEDIELNYTDQEFVDMIALMLQEYLESMMFIPGQIADLPTEHPFFDLMVSYEVALDDAALLNGTTWIISDTITEETWITVNATLVYGDASALMDIELHVVPIDVLTIAEFKAVMDEEFYYIAAVVIFKDPGNSMMIVADETDFLFVQWSHDELMVGDLVLLYGQLATYENMTFIQNNPDDLFQEMLGRGVPIPLVPELYRIQDVLNMDPYNPEGYFIYSQVIGRLEKSPDEMNFYLSDQDGMLPVFVPDGIDPFALMNSIGLDVRLTGFLMVAGDGHMMYVLVYLGNPDDIEPAFTDQELVEYLANMFETGGTEKPFRPGATLMMPETYEPYGVQITYETYGDNASLFDLTTGIISDTITVETWISVRLTFTYNEAIAIAEFDLHVVPIETLTIAEFKLGTEGETYFVRGVVVLPQFEDGPMILADETGTLFVVASLPLRPGMEVIIEGVLSTYEGIPLIWDNTGVISYEIVSENVPYPIEPEVLTIAQFNAIDMTDVANWGRYVEVIGYIGEMGDSFYPLLQEYIDGGDFIPIVPMFLFQHDEPKIMMEPIFDPMQDFMNMQGFRFVMTGFLFPNMGEEDPYALDRMLLIPTKEDIVLDYYTDQEKMDALILAGQYFLEDRPYRPFDYLELPDYLPLLDANIIWEFVGTNGYAIDLDTMQIQDVMEVETLLFKATTTIGDLTQEYTFEITVYPYMFIMIEDFYGLQEGEFGKLHVIVAEVLNGWEYILQEPMSLLYLHAYGFEGLNEGDEIIIFGQKELYEGYVSMHGYSEYAYYTLIIDDQKEPLMVVDGDFVDLATRSTDWMNLLYYNAVKGHLIQDEYGTYYLTDGLHTIQLIPETYDVDLTLFTYLNMDVAVKFLNYKFYYSNYGPMWSGYVVDAPNIIEAITFTDENIRGFMMDYLKNDLDYYFKDGLTYGYSTTHPIYGGTMTVTVNPIYDSIVTISGNTFTFAESDLEQMVILTLTATYNGVDFVDEFEIVVHPYTDDMDMFPVGIHGPLPFIDFTMAPGTFGGLYVKEVDREYDWWSETSDMIVDLYFPFPHHVGASQFTLQYQDPITLEWSDYLWYDTPLVTTWDNFSIPVAGETTFRLITDTGLTSNVVHVAYETIDTYFAGWSLDQSMYISGVMSPFVGYGLELSGVTINRFDGSSVEGGYTLQWYRVNPVTFEMIAIEGATQHTYITTAADLGYMILIEVRGDGVNAGGVLRILAGESVKIPVAAHISSASTTGFYIAFDYQMPIEELQNLMIRDENWQHIEVTNIILAPTPYVYYVECNLVGVDSIQVELQGFQYLVGETFYGYFNWGIYHNIRGW